MWILVPRRHWPDARRSPFLFGSLQDARLPSKKIQTASKTTSQLNAIFWLGLFAFSWAGSSRGHERGASGKKHAVTTTPFLSPSPPPHPHTPRSPSVGTSPTSAPCPAPCRSTSPRNPAHLA